MSQDTNSQSDDTSKSTLTTVPPGGPWHQRLADAISNDAFNDWYSERQTTENILKGQLYFNGLSPPPEPEKHTPSKLLQCHRKVAYQRENAPREGASPEGLFWSGERFEEDVMVPFLQDDVTTEGTYVENSKWIGTTIETDEYSLRLKGSTDPVIVTKEGSPLLVTEVKTKSSIEHQDGPDQRHRAQLHAYLYALDEEYDRSVEHGLLIYGSRTTFDIEVFRVSFDPDFWETVIEWMATQTKYRDADELPPAEPETDWECDFCSFAHRCGQTDEPYQDEGYDGLLPGVEDYRKRQVREYLEAAEDAALTPTLTEKYPSLAREFAVSDLVCPNCGARKPWEEVEKVPRPGSMPLCEACSDDVDVPEALVVAYDEM
ncbi:CRISPR-associated protein Cas4 [Halanaeroarchaeum sulfurireducens]|uniref:PD-(D/E)XK endonuclease-like domain-containing protein n=1 Tax=Halanaeroarchaeum sulfurireducens TaxID=1604004 RepID=A0A0F7PCZ8_9EURY|nr:PD-(D/E)XK nuclease family protein [Halanaeroarchaeum sulfurireducens]AKH97514.1 hypothetical protein HLASF_1025 [Halanaeroarchaeum sulfurireducens]ALG81910.1 hypothetical protein HLASA_1014 [Halanaeroarchaeum sulfurireducens]